MAALKRMWARRVETSLTPLALQRLRVKNITASLANETACDLDCQGFSAARAMFFAMAGKMNLWKGETNAQYSWPRMPLGMKIALCLKSLPPRPC